MNKITGSIDNTEVRIYTGKNSRVDRVQVVENGVKRSVVVKTYYKDFIEREAKRLRCEEIQLMETKLNLMEALEDNEGIVGIYDLRNETENEWKMVMEDGGDALEIRQYPVEDVRAWMVQLSCAVFYLHDRLKVCHCDIKPANIVKKNNDVKLCDLDSAFFIKCSNDDTRTRWDISPAFAPPELCSFTSSRGLTPEVHGMELDIWCLGVTLYCLLFGRTPFDANLSVVKLYEEIVSKDVVYSTVLNKNNQQVPLPADMKDMLDGLLAKAPRKRCNARELMLFATERNLN